MFLKIEDLGSTMYGYQIEQITEGNETILLHAIDTAIDEVKSYLTANNKREWLDGRLNYDINAIFSAKGKKRNPLILSHTKIIAKWWITDLSNADLIYEQAKERYEFSVKWLTNLAEGKVNLNSLPVLSEDSENTTETFVWTSRKKFRHE